MRIQNPNLPVIIERDIINDKRLGYMEIAIYAYLSSIPDGTSVEIEDIENRFFPAGRSLQHALSRLKTCGYILYDGPDGTGDENG